MTLTDRRLSGRSRIARGQRAVVVRARCKADDRLAHDELYHRFRRQVAGNLYRVLGDRTDLDDLVQEVFVIAFRGLERFRGDARLSTWLYRICVNVALGKIRTRKRRPAAINRSISRAARADSNSNQVIGVDTVGACPARSEYAHTVVLCESFWLQSTKTFPSRWDLDMFAVTCCGSSATNLSAMARAKLLVRSNVTAELSGT